MAKMYFVKAKRRALIFERLAQEKDPRFDHLFHLPNQETPMPTFTKPPTPISLGVVTETMMITPTMAEKWLEGNVHNRKLRSREVDKLSAAMKSGRWKLNGESIIFSSDGVLLDGQHRLYACWNTGISFESVVVRGVDPETFTTIDQGRHRSPANHLEVSAIKSGYTTTIAAVAAQVIRYRTDNVFALNHPDPADVVRTVQEEPDIIAWVDKLKRSPEGLRGPITPMAATLYLGSRNLPEAADKFLHHWVTGSDLAVGSPVLTLRQRFLNVNTRKLSGPRWERFFLCISAWNAFAEGRSLLKMSASLKSTDKFPAIKGFNK